MSDKLREKTEELIRTAFSHERDQDGNCTYIVNGDILEAALRSVAERDVEIALREGSAHSSLIVSDAIRREWNLNECD